eukprot:g16661.t1
MPLSARASRGRRPLHYAAENGNVEVLERLLAATATVEADDRDRQRPLHLAASKGHVEVLERLLAARATVEADDRDATVDAEQKSGERPLHWAAWSGHRHVVERLLAAGAVVEAQDKKCGCRPLHWAAFEGHLPEGHKWKVMGVLRPVHVLLLSGEAVPCDPQPYRTVRDLREEVQKKLKLQDTEIQLIASAGDKLCLWLVCVLYIVSMCVSDQRILASTSG